MQSKKNKISIIVPCYNVEKYLKVCVDSILNQSFKDFELFLVDDGSKDNTLKIIKDYQKKDKRIKPLHQKNSGAFTARNNALKKANCEYVFFFDADDYIEKNTLHDLYNLANKNKSDIVISGFYIHTYYNDKDYITLNYIPYTSNNENIEIIKDKNVFRKYAYKNFDKNMFYPPWNKLYKLSYLKTHKIQFPKTYRDDFPFVLSCIKDVENVCYTKKQYYHFIRKRSDSETQKYYKGLYEKREEEHLMMLNTYKYWNLLDDNDSLEMISRRYIDRIIECMTNLFNRDCHLATNEKKDEIKRYLYNSNLDSCIKLAKPGRFYLKFMYVPIKLKSIELCYNMAKFINYIKSNNIALFSSLKTNR